MSKKIKFKKKYLKLKNTAVTEYVVGLTTSVGSISYIKNFFYFIVSDGTAC